jgi:hypothetical protein
MRLLPRVRMCRELLAAALVTSMLIVPATDAHAARPLPIIPGAAGFGMETPAGSGRHLDVPKTTVIKVTNLNPDGPGSLRAALQAEGPRVVVFEVSGNIEMVGAVSIKHPYLTVAGQTAPSPGITLKRCELNIRASDVLLQHIRVRVGDLLDPTRPERNEKSGWTQWSERDNMKVGGDRVVVDHCSFSWSTDENVQSRGSNLTFRHNIFSEGLNSSKHHKGGHSKGLLILKQGEGEGQNVAVVGNLFAHNTDRNPSASAGVKMVVINNLVYGACLRPGIAMTLQNAPRRGNTHGGGACASVIANHFDKTRCGIRFISRRDEEVGRVFLGDLLFSYTEDQQAQYENAMKKILSEKQFEEYQKNRESAHGPADELIRDPWNAPHMLIFKEWCGETVYPERSKVTSPPVVVPGLTIRPVGEVRDWVLANAGARPADRDAVDQRVVREVRTRTGDVIQSQDDVGGWPKLAENRRQLTLPDNPHGDDDGDGYTNLEEWLHAFAAEVEGRK